MTQTKTDNKFRVAYLCRQRWSRSYPSSGPPGSPLSSYKMIYYQREEPPGQPSRGGSPAALQRRQARIAGEPAASWPPLNFEASGQEPPHPSLGYLVLTVHPPSLSRCLKHLAKPRTHQYIAFLESKQSRSSEGLAAHANGA